ncbi:MAG: hypothetical protein ACE5JP_06225 [Candidatus Bipolaricaulia bacterium]
MYLPTEHVRAIIRRNLQLAVAVAAFVLVVGLLASIVLARRVTEPVARLTAAAVEAETFQPESLENVTMCTDELGQGGAPHRNQRNQEGTPSR